MHSKKYPRYYKQQEAKRFMKRIDNLAYIIVQVKGFIDGTFIHSHKKDIVYTDEILDDEIKNWTPCTEDEYESAVAAYFQFARRDGELFSQYRQRKYELQKQGKL